MMTRVALSKKLQTYCREIQVILISNVYRSSQEQRCKQSDIDSKNCHNIGMRNCKTNAEGR